MMQDMDVHTHILNFQMITKINKEQLNKKKQLMYVILGSSTADVCSDCLQR